MASTHAAILVALTFVLAIVSSKASDQERIDKLTTEVVTKLQEAVIKTATEPDGLTQDRLVQTAKTTLAGMSSQMKELKKLDPNNAKVPKMVADKLCNQIAPVIALTGLKPEEVKTNVDTLRDLVTENVKEYLSKAK